MSSKFTTAVHIAITLAISALLATGCSKSTSNDQPNLVVVEPIAPPNDGTTGNVAGSTTDSGASESASDTTEGTPPFIEGPLEPVKASYKLVADKTFRISWEAAQGAQFYRILENADGLSGFVQISDDLATSTQVFDHRVALYRRVNARYIVQACNANSCMDSEELIVSGSLVDAIGYFKASNSDADDFFGMSIALNSDGTVLAVGAMSESSAASGVNGNQEDNSAENSGAVYVFVRSNLRWQQQAYIKASNPEKRDGFGANLALSSDGNTLAVGAIGEASAATGINGNQSDNSSTESGAVYVFTNSNGNWQQQAYLKASNTDVGDWFGSKVSLSRDGNTLVVAAIYEDSNAALINGDESNNLARLAGAVYVFTRTSEDWEQEAYLKASNAGADDRFGSSLGLSADGNTLAVGASDESSAATGINGDQNNNEAVRAGAVYLFERIDSVNTTSTINGNWQQHSYIKASNTDPVDNFGRRLSLSADGETLAVTAWAEDSSATGVDGDQTDNSIGDSGAVYVFDKSGRNWQQAAYVKSSNGELYDQFGTTVSLSGDGNTMVVGAGGESSVALGINGNQNDNGSRRSGAAYVFERRNGSWQQQAYLKASNTDESMSFGTRTSLSSDGDTLAISASLEDNREVGINGNPNRGGLSTSGAVYLY